MGQLESDLESCLGPVTVPDTGFLGLTAREETYLYGGEDRDSLGLLAGASSGDFSRDGKTKVWPR